MLVTKKAFEAEKIERNVDKVHIWNRMVKSEAKLALSEAKLALLEECINELDAELGHTIEKFSNQFEEVRERHNVDGRVTIDIIYILCEIIGVTPKMLAKNIKKLKDSEFASEFVEELSKQKNEETLTKKKKSGRMKD